MKPPIDILPLFPVLNHELVSFLQNLSKDDWQRQTVARKWVIKDVAAHLLDGNLRKISRYRDHWRTVPGKLINSYQDLVDYLDEINNVWVMAAKRLSPRIIAEMLAATNDEVYAIFKSLDPFGKAEHSVAWAGENESYNWFNIAREYTEFFVHQQQMRDAVGDQGLLNSQLYHPFLDIFMRALPYTYRDIKAPEVTLLKFTITGQGGGHWFLKRMNDSWSLVPAVTGEMASETFIDGSVAWKLFSKSARKEDVKGSFEIKGNPLFGEKILDMVSVMA
jgi:uncharacterized protein (TIGR03083 family)